MPRVHVRFAIESCSVEELLFTRQSYSTRIVHAGWMYQTLSENEKENSGSALSAELSVVAIDSEEIRIFNRLIHQ